MCDLRYTKIYAVVEVEIGTMSGLLGLTVVDVRIT